MRTRTKIIIAACVGFFLFWVFGLSSLVLNYGKRSFLESPEYKIASDFALNDEAIRTESGGVIKIREEDAGGRWERDSIEVAFVAIGRKQNLVVVCYMIRTQEKSLKIYKTKFYPSKEE
jgi:hypothetical protein